MVLMPDGEVSSRSTSSFVAARLKPTLVPRECSKRQSLGDLTQLISMARISWGMPASALVLALVGDDDGDVGARTESREHAVLQTIGFSGPRVFQFGDGRECFAQSSRRRRLASRCRRCRLCSRSAASSVGAEAVTIAFTPSLRLAAIGMAVSAAAGLLAGIAPAIHAARTSIVPALRQA